MILQVDSTGLLPPPPWRVLSYFPQQQPFS
jgi:hypothetical protein